MSQPYRRALCAAATTLAALVPLLMPQAAQAASSAGTFPMQGYGPARNGLARNEHTITTGNVTTLSQHFARAVTRNLSTAATVGEDMAYVGYGSTTKLPYVLTAYRLSSGSIAWKLPARTAFDAVYEQPVLQGTVLYVADGPNIVALDAPSGRVIWTSPSFSASGLNVVGTIIYALIGTDTGTDLAAVSTADGSLLWSVPTENASSVVTYWGNQLFIIDHNSSGYDEVRAFRAADGGALWTTPVVGSGPGSSAAVAVADGGGVFVVTDQASYRLRSTDGGVVWQQPLGSYVNLALAYGNVYVIGTNGHMTALSTVDGSTVWQSAAATYANDYSGVTVANGVVYAANPSATSNPDTLSGLDATTGSSLWTSSVVGSILVDISVTGGKVLAMAGNSGQTLFEFTLAGL